MGQFYDLTEDEMQARQIVDKVHSASLNVDMDELESVIRKMQQFASAGYVFDPTVYRENINLMKPTLDYLKAFKEFRESGLTLIIETAKNKSDPEQQRIVEETVRRLIEVKRDHAKRQTRKEHHVEADN